MVRGNPALDQIEKILRLGNYLFSLRMDHLALAAGFEKNQEASGGSSQSQSGGFKRQPVMAGSAGKPVASSRSPMMSARRSSSSFSPLHVNRLSPGTEEK